VEKELLPRVNFFLLFFFLLSFSFCTKVVPMQSVTQKRKIFRGGGGWSCQQRRVCPSALISLFIFFASLARPTNICPAFRRFGTQSTLSFRLATRSTRTCSHPSDRFAPNACHLELFLCLDNPSPSFSIVSFSSRSRHLNDLWRHERGC